MKGLFIKGALLALCLCLTAGLYAQSFPITDDFDATDPGWAAPTYNPTGTSGNQQFERNQDISSITGPTIDAPSGSDAKILIMEVNAIDGNAQDLTTTIGDASWTDYSVECLALPWIAEGVTAGTSEFFGIGLRATNYGDDGYFAALRTDESGTYGAYVNLVKHDGGAETILERVFFKRGSDAGFADSPVINLNEGGENIPATYEWIQMKMEAVGDTIKWYIMDMDTPVFEYTDETPFSSGKACVFQTDPWGSTSEVYGIMDYVTIDEYTEPTPTPAPPGPGDIVYEKSFSVNSACLSVATDVAGGLYYGTFNGPDSGAYYIADPVNADDVATTIAEYASFPAGRGVQGVAVDSGGNVYISGDTGSAASPVFEKYGPAPTFTADAAFAPSDVDRFLGCDLFNDSYLAVCTFSSIRVYATADGARVGSGLYVAGDAYQRDVAVNPANEDVFVARNGNSNPGTVTYWTGGSTIPDNLSGYAATQSYISDVMESSTWGAAGQGIGFYAGKNWLLVNDRGTEGVEDGTLQIYRIVGSTATLIETLDGTDSGVTFGSAVDAAVAEYGEMGRIYISDLTNNRIVVYQFSTEDATAADAVWNVYE